jgi:hypothetical protein
MKVLRTDYAERAMRLRQRKAVGTFFRDIFTPKIGAIKNMRPETICEGNVCSTMPAQSFHKATGRSVVPGKPAQDVFPTDFLRSDAFDMVGSHTTKEVQAIEKGLARRMGPWALRGGMGAAMAGGTYAASEDPRGAAEVACGARRRAGSEQRDRRPHGLGQRSPAEVPAQTAQEDPRVPAAWEQMPTFVEGLSALKEEGGLRNADNRKIFGRFMTRRMPAVAAGSALAYGGVKGLEHLYDRATSE